MNMLIETLEALSASPWAWAGVAVLAALAVLTLIQWFMCPYLCQKHEISVEAAREALDRPVFANRRFALAMVIGIVLTLVGLKMIHQGSEPGLAFILIVAGVVVLQTEPIRLDMRQATARVVAASAGDEASYLAAAYRLRASHFWLVTVHFLVLFGVVAGLLLF